MTPAEFYKQEFAEFEKQWSAGQLPALFDAVKFAQINAIALPEWCALAVMNLIIDRFNAAGGRKLRSKYAVDYSHYRRWCVLSWMFRVHSITYSKRAGAPKKEDRGIEKARKEASELLRGTSDFGTPRQVQRSFDLVEKAGADGANGRFSFGDRQ